MICTFAQDDGGTLHRGGDVLAQVGAVDVVPNPLGEVDGGGVVQASVLAEEAVRLAESRRTKLQEPLDEPVADVGLVGVHVDGEVDQVANGQRGVAAGRRPRGRLQDVESFEDEDVWTVDNGVLVGDDVVDDVAVDGCGDVWAASFDVADELEQGGGVVGLGEAFAVDEAAGLEVGVA